MPESTRRGAVLVEENSPRSTIPVTTDRMMGPDPLLASSTSKNGSNCEAPPPPETTTAPTTTSIPEDSSTEAVTPILAKEVILEGTSSSGPPVPNAPHGGDCTPAMTSKDIATPMTPLPPVDYSYGPPYTANLTPRSGYYGYNMTPEPASPATHAAVYDVTSFLQQQQQHNGGLYPNSPFLSQNNTSTSLSPTRSGLAHGVIPPPSPLFPRVNSTDSATQGQPPVLPYMSPQVGYNHAGAAEDWNIPPNERHPTYAANAYNFPRRAARSYSIEESTAMLPPAALEDPGNPAYSPYGGSQASYSMQIPPWSYAAGGGIADPYNNPNSAAPPSPLQPRPMYRPVYNNGYYAPAAPNQSPGPPIQTTTSNKGPDGANLFIFHIPNDFTNVNMYQLFQQYGNLLSVRIMIEKETGRSRGFGFVSYDSPESAALAIKELNGYAIGNKRLKVQHKQIRRQDVADREPSQDSFTSADGYGPPPRGVGYPPSTSLPPSGAAASHMWYEKDQSAPAESSGLSDLGAMADALPDIAGKAVVEEERTAVA